MLNLLKYELKKNKAVLITLAFIVFGLEGYYLVSFAMDKLDHMGIASSFLSLISVISFAIVFILGITNYQKELCSKTSYMVFMTPNSSLKIIGSKLCYVLLLGIATAIVLGGLAVLDLGLLGTLVDEQYHIFDLIKMLAEHLGIDLTLIMGYFTIRLIYFILSVLSVVTVAYLAITLSATLLYNSRFRGIISVVFFILLMVAVTYINNHIIADDLVVAMDFSEIFINSIPGIIYNAVVMIGCMFGCSFLIDRHISL
ncbi:MAG: hypothetical protein ACI4GD_11670 [Lachnospiraceae bacterium]